MDIGSRFCVLKKRQTVVPERSSFCVNYPLGTSRRLEKRSGVTFGAEQNPNLACKRINDE